MPSPRQRKTCWKKYRDAFFQRPSIVFTRKTVVDETFIRKSTNMSTATVKIHASHQQTFSMCLPMPTGLYTRCGSQATDKLIHTSTKQDP